MREQINVVIAEDEAPMLGALVSMVSHAGRPFHVAAAARDGEEALRQIIETRPQLALLDIQMPKLSGLDVLSAIREQKLNTKVIVISGYDQFQYAQQALRHGACEYLLKPVTPSQMESLLADMAAKLDAEAQAGQGFSPEAILSGARVHFPEAHACYLLALFALGNYPFAAQPGALPDPSPACIAEKSAQRALLDGEDAWCARGSEPWEQCVLMGLNTLDRARPAAQALFEALTREAGPLPVTLAVSKPLDAAIAGEEARRLSGELRKGAVFGKSVCIGPGQSARSQSIQQLFNRCAVYEEQMVAAIAKGDLARFKVLLADELNYWSGAECPASMMLNLIKFQFIHLGNAASGDSGRANALPGDWDGHFDRAMSQSANWKQFYEQLCALMEKLSGSRLQSGSGDILRQIDDYINKNYAAHINTQTLSHQFGFVPSYISKLFRQYKGMSPSEYLTNVRIEKAKELIRSISDVNVADIAAAVGFSDPSYFSRLFHKMCGLLPTEYRDRHFTDK
jgi:AraC-like DNA-binding protein/CheY-like chemotaxis protein